MIPINGCGLPTSSPALPTQNESSASLSRSATLTLFAAVQRPTSTPDITPPTIPPTLTVTPLLAAQSNYCQVDGVVRVATDASYPPFETINDTTKEFEGFDIDILNAIAYAEKLQVKYQNENFETIFVKLAQKDYDLIISAATITQERQQTVDFSAPYFIDGLVIAYRPLDEDTTKTLPGLQGVRIGVLKGTTGEEYATKQIKGGKVTSYSLGGEAMTALANKEVDAVIIERSFALNYLVSQPGLGLAVYKDMLTSFSYGIAVRKGCDDLLKSVNSGLNAIIKDGTYNKIYQQHFGEYAPAQFLPK